MSDNDVFTKAADLIERSSKSRLLFGPSSEPTHVYDVFDVLGVDRPVQNETSTTDDKEYTGSSVSYYQVRIDDPTTPGRPSYIAEANDIIEALGMTFAEGNVFKAIWRMAASRQGLSKRGYEDGLYDAEKVVFFGQRLVAKARRKPV